MDCPECYQPMMTARIGPNPRTQGLMRSAQPCGHLLGPHEWEEALKQGVPSLAIPVTGATLIGAERERQITVKGYTTEHDQQHTGNELAWATFALMDRAVNPAASEQAPPVWPWDRDRWPQHLDTDGLLIQAGAYICAEIDRRRAKGDVR